MRGPNIQFVEPRGALQDTIRCRVILKLGDNITTDHIAPAGAKVLPFRSNIPRMAEYAFHHINPDFHEKALAAGPGVVVGGENYGQGSSREHAALVPMYLGIQAVLARSFARIHKANLVNFGVVPLVFADPGDYERLEQGDRLEFRGLRSAVLDGAAEVVARCQEREITLRLEVTSRDRKLLAAGGLLNHIKASL